MECIACCLILSACFDSATYTAMHALRVCPSLCCLKSALHMAVLCKGNYASFAALCSSIALKSLSLILSGPAG